MDLLDKVEDLKEAQTTAELSCSKLSPTTSASETHTLSVWQSLEWTKESVDLNMVTIVLEKEDRGLSTRKIKVLPKSTRDQSLFTDDIFRHQIVPLGNWCKYSRHLMTDSIRPASVSAASISSKKETSSTGFIQMEEKKRKGLMEEQDKKAVIKEQKQTCTQLPAVEEPELVELLEKLESLSTEWKQQIQNEDIADSPVLTEEEFEEVEEKLKDKSVRRRFLNWVDELIQLYFRKKIEKTYQRESEEGDQLYLTNFYFFHPMTRAQREQQKRETWVRRDNHRQDLKGRLDGFWEKKRMKKEALKIKEEERYQKWMAEHKLSVSDPPPNEPKKRMSKWKKRCLRAKEFLHLPGSP